jgi:hypothetical protein
MNNEGQAVSVTRRGPHSPITSFNSRQLESVADRHLSLGMLACVAE